MTIKGVFYICIHATDMQRSKHFYGSTLAWQLQTDEPGVAGFAFGSGYLVVLDARAASVDVSVGTGQHVSVLVDGIESEYERLKGMGVAVSELQSRPWGERNFSFKDPDGYLWLYGQHG